MVFYELDVVDLANVLVGALPDVTRIAMFGSRKYPGKVRSDLDLLIEGPASGDTLVHFRASDVHYAPLDLWLISSETAFSVVNGSSLRVADLRAIELYPSPDLESLGRLRTQRFRTDIDYVMSMAPPPSVIVPVRADHLGLVERHPYLLHDDLQAAVETVLDMLRNAVQSAVRMRSDGNAKRGKGTHITISVEYDLQNLTELVLAPVLPIEREPFVVKVSGARRTADFSLADGRVVIELKLAKSGSELTSQLKDMHAVLDEYLKHPGVEIAIGIHGIAEDIAADVNAIESWRTQRRGRIAYSRVLRVPTILMSPLTP